MATKHTDQEEGSSTSALVVEQWEESKITKSDFLMKAKRTFNSACLWALLTKDTLATCCFVHLEAHCNFFASEFLPPTPTHPLPQF